jgi:hypothetical protein
MEHSYSNRNYLLPKGCKDLIDAIHLPREINADVVKREDGIIFKFKVADLREADADIVFEGRHLRIIAHKKTRNQKVAYIHTDCGWKKRLPVGVPHRILYVPTGHDLSKALTTYTEDEVRIFVPKC